MYQVHSTNVAKISELLRVSQNSNLNQRARHPGPSAGAGNTSLQMAGRGVPSFICVGSGASQTGILRNC